MLVGPGDLQPLCCSMVPRLSSLNWIHADLPFLKWGMVSGSRFDSRGGKVGCGVRGQGEGDIQLFSLLISLSSYEVSQIFALSVPKGFLIPLCSPGTLGRIPHGIVPSQLDPYITVYHDGSPGLPVRNRWSAAACRTH